LKGEKATYQLSHLSLSIRLVLALLLDSVPQILRVLWASSLGQYNAVALMTRYNNLG
jgi:hypothetical protein